MTILAIGQVCGAKGLCQGIDRAGDPIPYDMPAVAYMRHQRAPLPVYFGHDASFKLGEVVTLTRSMADGLVAVMSITADIEDLLHDHEWRISDRVSATKVGTMKYGQAQIRELSLVGRTENLSTQRVRWSSSETPPGNMPLNWYATWDAGVERLGSYAYRRRRSDVMDIVDLDPLGIVDEVLTDPDAALANSRAMDTAKARSAPKPPVVHRRSVGPKVNYYGVELEGEAAQRVLDDWVEASYARDMG